MRDLPRSADDPRLQGWYHTIELGNGMVSNGRFDLRTVVDRYGLPESLEGREVLDVGTGDGFFAFEMERRGAERVLAVDLPRVADCDWVPHLRTRLGASAEVQTWPEHFRMAKAMLGSKVEYRHCSIYDLSPYTVGTFDVVFCGSLLLHLQNPMLALHAIRSVTRELAIIETAACEDLDEQFPDRPLLTFGYPWAEDLPGQFNSYWMVTSAALQRMVEYAGFTDVRRHGKFLLPPSGPVAAVVTARPFTG